MIIMLSGRIDYLDFKDGDMNPIHGMIRALQSTIASLLCSAKSERGYLGEQKVKMKGIFVNLNFKITNYVVK